jgi:hypothetical protein
MKAKINPTDEQLYAIDCAKQLQSLKIEAFAGAAKTTTLKLITDSMTSKGLYLAFNKDIVASADFKEHITARTFHSYAFRAIGSNFGSRLNQRLYGSIVAEKLNLKDYSGRIKASWVGNYLLTVVENFCSTVDEVITEKHFHVPSDIRDPAEDKILMREKLTAKYLVDANRLWILMSDLNSNFPSRHSVYCKLWVMTKPKLDFDYIMMDEAQDMDVFMQNLLNYQDCPIFYVGDRYQSIYKWRGAINAMDKIPTNNIANLTMSFRFGQPIADMGNMILKNRFQETKRIRGNPDVNSRICEINNPNAILCRTNAVASKILIEKINEGAKDISSPSTKDAIDFFENVKLLKEHERAKGKWKLFSSYEELAYYSESLDGRDLAPYIHMEKKTGYQEILRMLRKIKPDESGSLVITTAHKAKGLEWSKVKLSNDYALPWSENYDEEESRLLYVAVTRAKHELDVSEINHILDGIRTGEPQSVPGSNNDMVLQEEKDEPFIILLDVPYMEKDRAKALGAKWNAPNKKWFITKNMDQKPFRKWLP